MSELSARSLPSVSIVMGTFSQVEESVRTTMTSARDGWDPFDSDITDDNMHRTSSEICSVSLLHLNRLRLRTIRSQSADSGLL